MSGASTLRQKRVRLAAAIRSGEGRHRGSVIDVFFPARDQAMKQSARPAGKRLPHRAMLLHLLINAADFPVMPACAGRPHLILPDPNSWIAGPSRPSPAMTMRGLRDPGPNAITMVQGGEFRWVGGDGVLG